MTSTTFAARVADRAQEIRFTRALLSILAAPFWVLGAIVGVIWVAVAWCAAAVVIGFADAGRVRRGTD